MALDPLTLIAVTIQAKVPRLTLDEAAHVAWEVLEALRKMGGHKPTEEGKE